VILKPDSSTSPEYVELESGLIVPEWVAEEKFAARRPRAVDLFCGCGGMSLGMIQGGFEVVAAAEIDLLSTVTYMHNLGSYPCEFHFVEPADGERLEKYLKKEMLRGDGIHECFVSGGNRQALGDFPGVGHFFLGDVRKLKGSDVLRAIGLKRGELDCVCGGPPCQGFTFAGKRQIHDPRNSLVFEFARLVVEMLPKTIVFENVPGILHMVTPEGIPVMDLFCRILQDGGFAGVDALKQTIESQRGAVGMLRVKMPRKKKAEKPGPKKEPRSTQRRLFA
jgi:DNA (cytosine-5)-methyltransferase 1